MSSIEIRLATHEDVARLAKFLREEYFTLSTPYPPINEAKLFRWILDNIDTGFVVVADLSGRIVGSIGMNAYQPAWSDAWVGDCSWFLVKKGFRAGTAVAKKIREKAEQLADEKNMACLFGIWTGDRVAAKERFYEGAGWSYVGGTFFRPAKAYREENDGRRRQDHDEAAEHDAE